jgi:hypothetical protein
MIDLIKRVDFHAYSAQRGNVWCSSKRTHVKNAQLDQNFTQGLEHLPHRKNSISSLKTFETPPCNVNREAMAGPK